MNTTPTPTLRKALRSGSLITAPGVFDMISAKVADNMGFPALYATGFGMTASHLGIADAGLASFTDMVGTAGRIAAGCRTPVIADADTGFGGLLNVRHTVRAYEAAGIAAIQIEDQESPKKCGHTPGRRVIDAVDMVMKVEVAVQARRNDDFLVVARTDARTALGLDEAIRRGRLYAAAGADIIFVESPESEAEMQRIADEIPAPLLVNNVEGGRTPLLPASRLQAMGYRVSIHPATGFLAAAAALERVYAGLRARDDSLDVQPADSYGFARICALFGFPEVWEFERQWAGRADQLARDR